ncbi:MAG: sensor histidine kinase [Saezia sp.]
MAEDMVGGKSILKNLTGLYDEPEQLSEKRLWQIFLLSRMCLAFILLLLQLLLSSLHDTRLTTQNISFLAFAHIVYLLACFFVWFWASRSQNFLNYKAVLWVLTLGLDLAVFSWLYWGQQGAGGFFMLFFFLILMVATLGPRWLVYAVSGVLGLFIVIRSGALTAEFYQGDSVRDFVLQLFACGGILVVGELSRQLAVRMRSEEARAHKGLTSAKQQEGLNRLIVSDMSMGVVIGDSGASLKMINPAAMSLITGDEEVSETEDYAKRLEEEPGWHQLQGVIKILFESGVINRWLVFDFMLEQGRHGPCMLQIKGRLVGSGDIGSQKKPEQEQEHNLCVLFLTDLRDVDKRMRQEKLAAMGRMSASIAHEIRNPLATIGSAATLLSEGLKDAPSLRLTEMVTTNVERLNRIVKDVLEAAHLEVHGDVEPIDLLWVLPNIINEWSNINPMGRRLFARWPDDVFGVFISFDEEHLRRVIVNLLDNAARYASHDEAAIFVTLEAYPTGESEKVRISVYSDSVILDSKVEHALFEPFFSTESRGTGLGLYICRNLCERYGSTLEFGRETLNLVGVEKIYSEFFIKADRVDPLPGETKIMLEQTFTPAGQGDEG